MSHPDSSFSLWPPTLPYSLPHTNYSFIVTFEIPDGEPSNPPGDDPRTAIVELRIRQWYKLFIEPIVGYRVTMDEDYIESPELTLQFKVPLYLLNVGLGAPLFQQCVSQQLAALPIAAGLCEFLKPHIQNYAVSVAQCQWSENQKVVKMIFSVLALKIDLVDRQECDRISFRK